MTIGDDLRTMLGWIPVRDRAGIQRSTLADQSPNAEGQTLTRQGFAPPPAVSLPPGMGRPDVDVETTGSIGGAQAAPVPRERVVASSPAAAPSPAVATKASDVVLAALEQQQRQAKMMQVIGSLGMIANSAFNRNPQSQASTKASLAGMIGAGGGGIDVKDITSLYDLREKERVSAQEQADRVTTVDTLQRMFGLSKQDAEARYASGEHKKLLDPATIAKREADQRLARVRMDLSKPEVVAKIATITGQPEELVRADIANGKLGQAEIANILATQATTGKTIADTGKVIQETGEKGRADIEYQFYQSHPEAYKQLHKLESVEEAKAILNSRKSYDKHQETSGPTAYAAEAAYTRARREAIERGEKPPTRQEWEVLPSPKPSVAEKGEERAQGMVIDMHAENLKKARDLKNENENNLATLEELWSKNLRSGSKFSETKFEWKKVILESLGQQLNKEDANTELFFTKLKEGVLGKAGELKGPLSDADRRFIESLNGNMQITPKTIRKLLYLRERSNNMRIAQTNRGVEEDAGKVPALKALPLTEYPVPNRFMRAEVQERMPGLVKRAVDTGAINNPTTNRELQATFEKEFGPGVYHHLVREELARRGANP